MSTWNYRDVPLEHFGKVSYIPKDGGMTQAYIDMRTGEGENKHTGEYVKVAWSNGFKEWVEI